MSLFNTVALGVTRKSAGSYIKGRWVDGSTISFNVTGSLQPVSGNKAQALMEGKRLISIMEFITAVKLIAADPITQISGDIVTIDGNPYEVILVEPWQNGILNHYACTMIRKDEVPEQETDITDETPA